MPIRTLEPRFPRLGAVSAGHQTKNKKGSIHPVRTETMTFHSDRRDILEVVAGHVGGTVEESPTSTERKERWFLVSEVTELRVFLPSENLDVVCSQWMERWKSSGLDRRCDGIETVLHRRPPEKDEKVGELSDEICRCLCDAQGLEGDERCQPTVRLSVVPEALWADVPDIGVWMVRSTGFASNTELKSDLELIQNILPGGLGFGVPLLLRLEHVRSRHGDVPKFRLGLAQSPRETAELAKAGGPALGPAPEAYSALPSEEEPVGTFVDQPSLGNGAENAAPPAAPTDDDEEAGAEEPCEDQAESSSSAPAPVVIGPIEVTPLPEDEIPEPSKDKPTQQAWSALRRIADDLGLTEGGARKAFEIRYDGDLSKADKDTLADFGKWLREQEQKRRARA